MIHFMSPFFLLCAVFKMDLKMLLVHFAGIDLLEKMLVLDGDERPTAELALEHPYFNSLRDPDDFPEPKPYDDSHDNATMSLDEWKRK